eukprot:Clim_evm100s236 gene=Clim_evmTU100s236
MEHSKLIPTPEEQSPSSAVEAQKNEQVLDKLQVERERGITVKAQTVSCLYHNERDGLDYLVNIVDTPGHVDFSYEVSRSLGACQGVLLLVDATQGVQAQTVANFLLAAEAGLCVVPILNKIDVPHADVAATAKQMEGMFGTSEADMLLVSAKSGEGVDEVFPSIIDRVPPPSADEREGDKLKALLFDSWYDQYQGVICLLSLKNGSVSKGDTIMSCATGKEYEVSEVGLIHPDMVPMRALHTGQVGYVIAGIRDTRAAKVGDTFTRRDDPCEPLPGFKEAKPMVFAGFFPEDQDGIDRLQKALDRILLTDASVSVQSANSDGLGQGFRLGFLGTLHMDVFQQRLHQEFNSPVIVTRPTVPYKAQVREGRGEFEEINIATPADWPAVEHAHKYQYLEPIAMASSIFPREHMGKIMELFLNRRGLQEDMRMLDDNRVFVKYKIPLSEVVDDIFTAIKSATSGFATFDYEDAGWEVADIVKVSILLNRRPVDALSFITHSTRAFDDGKRVAEELRKVIPRQLFEVAIQAAIGSRVIARETVKAFRKDVTAKCYGGDMTRKKKLLEKQKEGKKRMRSIGNIQVPKEAFVAATARK